MTDSRESVVDALPEATTDHANLLDVRGLAVVFHGGRRRPPIRAVDGVDLHINERETLGLVGESGSGKTTLGRAILGLVPVTEGTLTFAGKDITNVGQRVRRRLSAELQVVFQDPYSSLNPTRTVGETLAEPLRVHNRLSRPEMAERVEQVLDQVGLPGEAARRYPSEFSGGQRQRIAIARALIVGPSLVICDEAVSALDLSVQAQVLNLLRQLQRDHAVSYLFISHDLAVVRHVSDRIAVLYRGQVVEHGDAATIYKTPNHPYTHMLLQAAPIPDPEAQRRRRLVRRAEQSSGHRAPSGTGCPFVPRCRHAIDECSSVRPALERTPEGSVVACHRWRELRGLAPVVAARVDTASREV
jgi:oligopeptide/dipeptide ABC transporter ATP-binding protein